MCFSPTITWMTVALGPITFVIAKTHHKSLRYYFAPLYFCFMEIIQGLMYLQLDHPSALAANILIYTAYLHVCFQPLVINHWLGSFINEDKKQIYHFTLKICFIGGILLALRMFKTDMMPLCSSFEALCSVSPKIYMGFHHIVWSLPLTGAGLHYSTPSIALHMFLFFVPGLFFGLYRLVILMFLLGPFLSTYITPNVSEQPAIWCIIGLWMIVVTSWYAVFNKLPEWLQPES